MGLMVLERALGKRFVSCSDRWKVTTDFTQTPFGTTKFSRRPDAGYAPVPDDTKELESSLVQAATAWVPQNRNDNASVQAAYGVLINDHSRAEDSEKVTGGQAMNCGGQGRSFPRPGT
jgi:hypothetical protein